MITFANKKAEALAWLRELEAARRACEAVNPAAAERVVADIYLGVFDLTPFVSPIFPFTPFDLTNFDPNKPITFRGAL